MDNSQEGNWEISAKITDSNPDKKQLKVIHETIKKVTSDIESLDFNTAIAQMMVFTNAFTSANERPLSAMKTFLLLLNPFAPHITEELNSILTKKFPEICNKQDLSSSKWPKHDEKYLVEDEIEIVVQVNGKLRDKMVVNKDASEENIKEQSQKLEKIQPFLEGLTIRKIIFVPGKLINIVVN